MNTTIRFSNKAIALLICILLAFAQIQLIAFTHDSEAYAATPTSGTIGTAKNCKWEIDQNGKLTIKASDNNSGTLSGSNSSLIHAFDDIRDAITEVEIDSTVTLKGDLSHLFHDCINLTKANTASWNVSAVTDASHLFENCKALVDVDFSNWDTSNITNMDRMFSGCTSLTTLDVSKWKTPKVTNMAKMFENDAKLETIDMKTWDTSKVQYIDGVFNGCTGLKTVSIGEDVFFVGNGATSGDFEIPSGNWYSSNDRKVYTASEINTKRSNISDTYLRVNKIATRIVIKGVSVPKAGETINTEHATVQAYAGDELIYEGISPATWSNNKGENKEDKTFQQGTTYYLTIGVALTNRNAFADQPSVEAQGFSKITQNNSFYSEKDLPFGSIGRAYIIEYIVPTPSTTDADTDAMYRLYNPNSGEHFYTASTVEREFLVGQGWTYEGIGWYAPKTGDPVYRLYNPNAGDHHYTLSTVEREFLIGQGWTYEGIGWKSGSGSPLYRLYNPNAVAGAHHYTLSAVERDWLVPQGWKYEGICWNSR